MFPEHKLTRADLICSEQNSGRAARESNTYKSTDTQSTYGQKNPTISSKIETCH